MTTIRIHIEIAIGYYLTAESIPQIIFILQIIHRINPFRDGGGRGWEGLLHNNKDYILQKIKIF